MDWFERLVGFPETSYIAVRSKLRMDGTLLRSIKHDRQYHCGSLELPSLAELRRRAGVAGTSRGPSKVTFITADVRELHRSPAYTGALFQVASQFNLLEMTGPDVTPEDGVTRYEWDRTQGPACAIAAGAATIFRNYFVPIDNQVGQTAARQLDALAGLGHTLSQKLDLPVADLWSMSNGYALCTAVGLDSIGRLLAISSNAKIDELRGQLRIGLHHQVQVTDLDGPLQLVSQAFCSALPIAYSSHPASLWEPFARFVLTAAYEATLLAALLNSQSGHSNIVVLTHLGGGAFGNPRAWIDDALHHAIASASTFGLDIHIVSLSSKR